MTRSTDPLERHLAAIRSVVRFSDIVGPEKAAEMAREERERNRRIRRRRLGLPTPKLDKQQEK